MSESVFNTSIRKLSKGKASKTGTYGKSEIEEQYNFTIYEELPVNVTETEKVMAYNIAVKSDSLTNANSFENLVINTDKTTNETEIHIVKYNLLSEITISEHGTPDFESTIETTPIITNKNGACCFDYPAVMCSYGTRDHLAGQSCLENNFDLLYVGTQTACRNCVGGGDDSAASTSGSPMNPTNPTTQGGGSNPVIISTPVVPVKPKPDQIIANFVALLDQQEQQWWNDSNNSQAVANLSIFLIKNYPLDNIKRELVEQVLNDIKNIPNEIIDVSNVNITPPSCESFAFQPISNTSNWQESAVKNISFRVFLLTLPNNISFNYEIVLPQPTLFGCPINLSIGNTTITSGMAAEISANALNISIKEIVKKYGNSQMDPDLIKIYFQERLKFNYPLMTSGGRVQFDAMNYSGIIKEYKTNAYGTGNCN